MFCFSQPPGRSSWPQQPPLVHRCRRKPALASACAVGHRGSAVVYSLTPTRDVATPMQGECSGWKAEGGRGWTGTGSCPGPQMLSCTCLHWVSPPTSSRPRFDVQPCAPVGIHLVLREPCHSPFLVVPQTGKPVWTGVSELYSSCALKREDFSKRLGDGQRRRGLLAVACPWRAKSLCPSTAYLLREPPPPQAPERQCDSGIRGTATQGRQTTHRQPLVPGTALLGQAGSHVRTPRVWELQWLGALQEQTPPRLYAWGADLRKWAPGTDGSGRKGAGPRCVSTCREACPGRGRAGRKDRLGDSLMSPCNLWELVGGFIIDWHQAEMPANCLQISHDCRGNKEQTG